MPQQTSCEMPRHQTSRRVINGPVRSKGSRRRHIRRRHAVALAERPLHQHRIHPAPELEAHRAKRADETESLALVQGDGGRVAAVADDGDHLPPAPRLAARDEGGKQMAADAAAAQRLADIDGVLDRIAIGGAGAIGCCIAVADDGTARLCDEIGQAAAERVLAPARELLDRGRLLLEGGQPVPDMMRIDALDCWQIGGKRIADYGVTHEFGLLLRLAWSCGGSPRGWIGSRAAANRLYFRRRREGEPRCRASISFPRPISPRSRTPCRVSRARSRPASTLRARNAPSSARTRPSPSWRTTPSSSSRCKSW